MVDTSTIQSAQATPLALFLESTAKPPALFSYCGALTPQQLDAPAAETEALVADAAVHDLGWQTRIAVRGEDRVRWLSGMVTNMVKDLAAGAGAWNFVLDAQGRIQGDLTVWREADAFELEIAADQRQKLLAHLDRFIIMDDVELGPIEGQSTKGQTALGLTGPRSVEVLAALGLPALDEAMTSAQVAWNGFDLKLMRTYGLLAPHYELWIEAAGLPRLWKSLRTGGATAVGAASLQAFGIAEAIPAYGVDITERDLPQETSQMRALHFNKGCYLGQEIVERIHSRGSVHRHLCALELSGPVPEPGTGLTMEDGTTAGQITSAAELPLARGKRIFALGMIRAEAELRDQAFRYTAASSTGSARILSAAPVFENA